MKRLAFIVLSLFLLSCSNGKFETKQIETVNRVERCIEVISTAWIAKHMLTDEEKMDFIGEKAKHNVEEIWYSEREKSKILIDSIDGNIKELKEIGGESFEDVVSIYASLRQYYDVAINPDGRNDSSPFNAEELRLNLEKSLREFKIRYINNK